MTCGTDCAEPLPTIDCFGEPLTILTLPVKERGEGLRWNEGLRKFFERFFAVIS